MKLIRIISDWLAKIESAFLILLLSAMILIAFLQVILRNFFESSILWGDTLLRHLVLWVGFIGASLATRDDRHIKIDVLSRFLPERLKNVVQIITHLFASIICYFLFRASLTFIEFEKESGSTLFANIPTWIFQSILVIGFGLIGFRFLLRAIEETFEIGASSRKEARES